ncbi:tetratricopeptide repeat protein [Frigoribacterium sp. 2-23]|uniref:tetratricopeptide repeat protein n=1 Tax=Frigoribacterium sp. 2-23 TaxID=3415006 RepID=UPI003C6F69EF
MRGRIAAVVMSVLLVVYIALVVQKAVLFVVSGEPVAVVLGIALFVLPAIGVFALVAEVRFGLRTQAMVRQLEAEGELPVDDVPRRASGRYERDAADAAFPAYKSAVEQAPDDWRAWFRLGLAYDACGDRRRARQALRWSIRLRRESATAS